MMTIQNYVRPQSLQQAYDLCQNRRNRIVAGHAVAAQTGGSVNTAVDLCDLGLDTIEETDDAFVIGAMTPLRKLELHPGFAAYIGGAAAGRWEILWACSSATWPRWEAASMAGSVFPTC